MRGGPRLYEVTGRYLKALRSSRRETVVCDVWRGGVQIEADLPIDGQSGGSVTDTSTPGVRRQLDVNLVKQPDLFDLFQPTGTELRVRSVLTYPSGATETVPMGVFDVASAKMGVGPSGTISLAADDKWVKVQRAGFLTPRASDWGTTIPDQIAILLREVFGPSETVVNLSGNATLIGPLVWEGDRDKVIIDLATSIGCWVFFDRNGVATIAPLPTGDPGMGVWTVDAGERGIMLDGSRSVDRSKTRNVVVVTSNRSDGTPLFPPMVVWDDDPRSPTFAGTNPWFGNDVGPFGIVPERYSSPLLTTGEEALTAGRTMLNRLVGLNKQLSLTAVRNHALDALDPLTVVLPRERYDRDQVTEQHVIDKITHPLTPDGTQTIETRSTRTDEVS